MVIGITMIKIVPGHEKASYDSLKETDGVKEIYHLFGEYDFFLILEAADRTGLSGLLEEVKSDRYILDSWPLLVSRESDNAIHPSIGMTFTSAGELAAS
ncbi:MAG: Lrp/AsnC ligand binding domain-containing protein [Methanothrix sp.]|nr:Lrp/AsnC ligand binding domain-containing protein [Methanothrix sp.]